jgi:hypothetical protein
MRRFSSFVVLVIVLVGCGGGGGSSANSTATAWVRDVLDGKYSASYDLMHPTVQASTTREAYLACAASKGAAPAGVKLSVVESTNGSYAKADGTKVDATAVTVRAAGGAVASNVVVWVVDGRVAAADSDGGSSKPCAARL